MEYLFQYPVKTDIYNDNDVEFKLENLRIILSFRNQYVYTQGKKIRIIAISDKPFDGLKAVHKTFHEFYDLFCVYTIDNFLLGPLEIILLNQNGCRERTLLYDLVKLPQDNRDCIRSYNAAAIQNLLSTSIETNDKQCLYYLSRAVQASHLYDKYLNVFHALESIAIKSKLYRRCNKCKSLLVCPKCQNGIYCNSHQTTETCDDCRNILDSTTSFEKLTEDDLHSALSKINLDIGMGALDIKEMVKIRNLCAHPGKKGRINLQKAEHYAHILSVDLNYYLSSKYGNHFGGGGIYQTGTHTGFYKDAFTTSNPSEDFALDVPRMTDLEKSGKMEPADFS
jgi:hypothetical protein